MRLCKVVLSIHLINKYVVSCCAGGGTERLMVKCHQYWPSAPGEVMELPSSQLSVELLSEAPHERLSRLQIRKFKVKRFHAFPEKPLHFSFKIFATYR